VTSEGELGERIVSAVADRKSLSVDSLPPLYESIEPDALEELVGHAATMHDTELVVQFSYAGYIVTVRGSQEISIEDGALYRIP